MSATHGTSDTKQVIRKERKTRVGAGSTMSAPSGRQRQLDSAVRVVASSVSASRHSNRDEDLSEENAEEIRKLYLTYENTLIPRLTFFCLRANART